MKFSIAFRESKYVVKRFKATTEAEAENIFSIFLSKEIKKPCHDRLFLKRVS